MLCAFLVCQDSVQSGIEEELLDGNYIVISTQFKKTHALVDCGATGYAFVDEEFARDQNFPLFKLKKPHCREVIDGRPIESGLITHITKLRMTSLRGSLCNQTRSGDLPKEGDKHDERIEFQHQAVLKSHNLTDLLDVDKLNVDKPNALTVVCGQVLEDVEEVRQAEDDVEDNDNVEEVPRVEDDVPRSLPPVLVDPWPPLLGYLGLTMGNYMASFASLSSSASFTCSSVSSLAFSLSLSFGGWRCHGLP